MSSRDPWIVLGVDRSADDSQIKRAYRSKARDYHPDRNQGDPEAAALFQEVARAYEQIKNEHARDVWLIENEFQGLNDPSPAQGFPPYEAASGSAPRQQLREEIQISFAQAFSGSQAEISIELESVCSKCAGSGSAPGYQPRGCGVCGGSGTVSIGSLATPCSACAGRGFIIEHPCTSCDGGLIKGRRPFQVHIPPGVSDGQQLKIQGPDRGRFGPTEIIVTVRVAPSPVFKREFEDKAHLIIDVPISYTEAALGAKVRIPTPARDVHLSVPPSTPSGKIFRIAGAGMPRAGGEPGHLYVRVQIVVPEQLSRGQRKLIEQLGRDDPADLRYSLFNPHAERDAA